MPLGLIGFAITALTAEGVDAVKRGEAVKYAADNDMPTYFSDGERDRLTGQKCILERAGDGWVTYDPKTYRPMSAYGKYDKRYWMLWTEVVKNKHLWI